MMRALSLPEGAIEVEAVGMTMRFGTFTALDNVSLRVEAGSFHALLGENGAGKSTLVKCMMGYYQANEGGLLVSGKEARINDPRAAHAFGLGMVYQHFTLVPALTVAENLIISANDTPAIIDWRTARARLSKFMATMPFTVSLDDQVATLAAGEKQKLEILKQLWLGRKLLILDEPTSVLTPQEADEILGHVRDLCRVGRISVLMITHKFREVMAFADEVSILRRGRFVGGGKVSELTQAQMSAMMIGEAKLAQPAPRLGDRDALVLEINGLNAVDRSGQKGLSIASLQVYSREIVGIAGISGNGQKELMEVLTGERPCHAGKISVKGAPWNASRSAARRLNVRFLPEEPLRNACAPGMTVAENIGFRVFDGVSVKKKFWLHPGEMRRHAETLVAQFGVKTASLDAPISALSGGNVQRAVLARELTGPVDLLVISNPCFGLDFAAVSEIRARILAARNEGAAVLLMSEDLDEILELSDRVLVMSEGRITYNRPVAQAHLQDIGNFMGGAH
ncbi:nucleoside ABC transporter ATP-binding protein [Roseinatronobacter thiooxidans]|uniref:Nucleoside ABC transporter ATP-binding protein n=1 Tax=Roseinatronobacter thiooxidans TaxID=121821 RepID=A0A2W7RE78_9RHOB|nr:ABC transporter ATP-binding protein [Roseinatronobacter thiooxidans]PZX36262.1 nucleoside ABC transporter ATP-binding protein [Roseinatronobacter thiooxidans]